MPSITNPQVRAPQRSFPEADRSARRLSVRVRRDELSTPDALPSASKHRGQSTGRTLCKVEIPHTHDPSPPDVSQSRSFSFDRPVPDTVRKIGHPGTRSDIREGRRGFPRALRTARIRSRSRCAAVSAPVRPSRHRPGRGRARGCWRPGESSRVHSWRLAATSSRCPYEQPRWDGTRHAAHRVDDPDQPPGATFSLAPRSGAWGVGYGIETVRLLLACGFKDLGRHRVWGARSPSTRDRRGR
jgi:hypothetical protein